MGRPLVAALCAIALAACSASSPPPPSEEPPRLVDGAVVETTPDGFKATMRALEGEPLVVNWWASWCIPCATEMPILARAARDYDGRVAFLGVNPKDDAKAATAFLARYEVPFPSVGDPGGEIMRDQGIVGIPVTRFYRADGVLAFVRNGDIDDETLRRRIEQLLRIG
ncbi:MAG TPA: TlpA disulfide reductase family protein [Actinomycetota bacterium]|nr:TlpA disulfide reductase family protein [Actinomycetota bacterium]